MPWEVLLFALHYLARVSALRWTMSGFTAGVAAIIALLACTYVLEAWAEFLWKREQLLSD